MGSRARFAAAACLMVSGLLANGGCAPTAFAQPGSAATEDTVGNPDGDRPRPDGVEDSDAVDEGGPDDEPDGDTPGDTPRGGAGPKIPAGAAGDDLPDENPDPDGKPVVDDEEGGMNEDRPRPPCCEDPGDVCEPGWPVPRPDDPDASPAPGGSDRGNRPEGVPSIGPIPGGIVAPGREPPSGEPGAPGVLDVVPGIGIAASDTSPAPVSVPIVVTAPGGGGAGTAVGGAAGAGSPAPPLRAAVETPPLPGAARGNVTTGAPAYRVGYAEYLRGAGISQIAALALPGLCGLLFLTGAGGLVGYRQAKAGKGVRGSGIARFMN